MSEQAMMAAMAIHLGYLEAKLRAIEKILIRSNLCSQEGIDAGTEAELTEKLPMIVGETQSQITSVVKAMDRDGLSFDTIIQRLQARRDAWKSDQDSEK